MSYRDYTYAIQYIFKESYLLSFSNSFDFKCLLSHLENNVSMFFPQFEFLEGLLTVFAHLHVGGNVFLRLVLQGLPWRLQVVLHCFDRQRNDDLIPKCTETYVILLKANWTATQFFQCLLLYRMSFKTIPVVTSPRWIRFRNWAKVWSVVSCRSSCLVW